MSFCISLGGIPVEIHNRYNYLKELCRPYFTSEAPAFSVSITDDQLEFEWKIRLGKYSYGICESTYLQRKIAQQLLSYHVVLIHSAVVAVDGVAYAFLAPSGTGKSTHIHLWHEVFGEKVTVINGDKPVYSYVNNVFTVHGSPWRGSEGMGMPCSAPVGAFCFLERGEENRIQPADADYVRKRIYRQVLLSRHPEDIAWFQGVLERLLLKIPFYRMECNTNPDAALVAYEALTHNSK